VRLDALQASGATGDSSHGCGACDDQSVVDSRNSYSLHDQLLPSRLGVATMTTSMEVRTFPLLGVPLHPLADPRRFV
jgi:hypothetical protein